MPVREGLSESSENSENSESSRNSGLLSCRQQKAKPIIMKKIAFFCCALLALGFASCDDKSDMGIMQVNPQLPEVAPSELAPVVASEIAGSSINLNGLGEIPAISAPAIENLPAGTDVVYDMQVATKADFSDAETIPVVDGKVSAAEWNKYFRNSFGMNNRAEANYVRFLAYFVQGTQRYRVGDLDTFYGSHKLTVTPVSFTYPTITCNTADGAMYLADFDGDGALYQGLVNLDGNFTFTINGKEYGLASGSELELGNKPCSVKTAALYIVNVNYADDKYTFTTTQVRNFGAIGDFSSWSKQTNLTQAGKTFTGDVDFGDNAEGEFKFRMSNNNSYTLGGYQYDLLFGGANMVVPGAGTYTVTVDFSNFPYTYTAVKK